MSLFVDITETSSPVIYTFTIKCLRAILEHGIACFKWRIYNHRHLTTTLEPSLDLLRKERLEGRLLTILNWPLCEVLPESIIHWQRSHWKVPESIQQVRNSLLELLGNRVPTLHEIATYHQMSTILPLVIFSAPCNKCRATPSVPQRATAVGAGPYRPSKRT